MRNKPVIINAAIIGDMNAMRQRGMTNREIAKELNICLATVRRHIGNQPSGLKAAYGSVVAHVTDIDKPGKAVSVSLAKQSSLHLVAQTKIMEGTHHHFTLDSFGNITIAMKNPDEKVRLNKDGMERYITELMDAYMELCECSQSSN